MQLGFFIRVTYGMGIRHSIDAYYWTFAVITLDGFLIQVLYVIRHRIISNGATHLFCYRIVMTWIVPLLFLRSYSEKDEEKIPDYRIL